MRQIFLVSLVAFIFSCNLSNSTKQNLRDTVIEKYFSMIDSSGMYDTTNINYKTLKAYVQDDTASLQRLDSFINDKKYHRKNWELWASDIPLPQLKQLNTDEAYRFIFSLQGSAAYEAITIFKKDSTFKLNYLFYIHDRDSSKFDKIKNFEKEVSKEQWDTLTEKINNASFWELKNDNNFRGWDGSDLTVIGFYKADNLEKSNYVHRFMGGKLNDAFYFIYYKLLDKNERQYANE